MNTKNHIAMARTIATALVLSFTPAAFAQGPTTPLGGVSPAPEPCPEYSQAVRDAEDLITQAKFQRGQANYNDDQARSIEKNVKDVRIARDAAQLAVDRKAADVARLDPRRDNAEFVKQTEYLRQYSSDLVKLETAAAEAGALIVQAIQYRELADRQRAAAVELEARARALLESARARCSARDDSPAEVIDGPADDTKEKKDKKEKKEKKEKNKDHSLRNGLFGTGLVIGTHFVLGGGRRARVHRPCRTIGCDHRGH